MTTAQTISTDWKATAAALDSQIGVLEQQQEQLGRDLSNAYELRNNLRGLRNRVLAADDGSSESAAQIQQVNDDLSRVESSISQLQNYNDQYSQEIIAKDNQLQEAERQIALATSGQNNAVTNTAPVNPEPGNNTTPEPPNVPVPVTVQPTIPAPTAEQIAFDEANAEPQAIEDESEFERQTQEIEFEQARQEAEAIELDRERAAFLEANAEPQTIDDPLELARLDAEDRFNETENIDTSDIVGGTTLARQSPYLIKGYTDWRFRISLADFDSSSTVNYLYWAENPGILKPLQETGGVLFPYNPKIDVTYSASYDSTTLTHSNFKQHHYKSSSVEQISLSADFTAQDSNEANYVLAVIHFFRSVTKMFYGKDLNPKNGVPPPLCYLNGYGTYNFNNHPVVITSFTQSYPDNVDYINANITDTGQSPVTGGSDGLVPYNRPVVGRPTPLQRLLGSGLTPGGNRASTPFANYNSYGDPKTLTRIPTKLNIQLSLLPVTTRYVYSNSFSLAEYATGKLIKSGFAATNSGGIW